MQNSTTPQKRQLKVTQMGVTYLPKTSTSKTLNGSGSYHITSDGILSKNPKHSTRVNYDSIKSNRTYKINKQKVRGRIINHVEAQRGYKQLYMVTVSFKPIITDKLAYKMLNNFLTRLRMLSKLKSYLWVAERQKNGTIHYHIAIPHSVDIKLYNEVMKKILYFQIKKHALNYPYSEAAIYNGVDIAKNRSTRKITNYAEISKRKLLSYYLTKYMSKSNEQFTNLAWHCSRDFSALFTTVYYDSKEMFKICQNPYPLVTDPIIYEWAHVMFWKYSPPDTILEPLTLINHVLLEELNYYQHKEHFNKIFKMN